MKSPLDLTSALKTAGTLGALIALCTLATACGPGGAGSFVKGAKVSTHVQNGDTWVDASVDLGTINLFLPTLGPIPIGGSNEVGSITLSSQQGYSELTLSADINQITHVSTMDGHLLPNGTPIPIAGAANVPVLAIPVSNGVLAYVSLSTTELMLGAAINIAEFQNLPVNGLNLFPSFSFGSVNGVAGIYTGNKSGIAVFVDGSSVLPKTAPAQGSALAAREALAPVAPRALRYQGVMPDRRDQADAEYALWQLGQDQDGEPLTVDQ